jgi:hypothetical protein
MLGCQVDWIWFMGWVHGPINYKSEFSSYLRAVSFMGVFVPLARGFQEKRSGF